MTELTLRLWFRKFKFLHNSHAILGAAVINFLCFSLCYIESSLGAFCSGTSVGSPGSLELVGIRSGTYAGSLGSLRVVDRTEITANVFAYSEEFLKYLKLAVMRS